MIAVAAAPRLTDALMVDSVGKNVVLLHSMVPRHNQPLLGPCNRARTLLDLLHGCPSQSPLAIVVETLFTEIALQVGCRKKPPALYAEAALWYSSALAVLELSVSNTIARMS